MVQKRRKQSIVRIIHRVILFLLIFCLLLVMFFVLGNFQNFLDSSQRIILFAISVTSILLLVFCAYGILLSILFSIIEKHWYYTRLVALYLLIAAFGVLFLLVSRGVLLLSTGVSV